MSHTTPSFLSSIPLFSVTSPIGVGGCGEVYKAVNNKTKKEVAIKIIEIQKKWKQRAFAREVQNLRVLSTCSGIISLYDAMVHEKTGMIITEICDSDLYSYLQSRPKTTNDEKRDLFYKTCKAVQQCHHNLIAHLDIKPGNILLSNGDVKLCDFGSSFKWSNEEDKVCSRITGTSNYQAPEVVKGNEFLASAVDIWELGVLLHIILTNQFPYDLEDKSNLTISENISAESFDLINSLLHLNPNSRPSIDDVLLHEYFTGPALKQTEEPEEISPPTSSQNRLTIVQRTLSIVKFFSGTKKQKKKKVEASDKPRPCKKTNSV